MENPINIFLVEDDLKLTGLIREYLERHHFVVTVEHDGSSAVSRILEAQPDLVLLDILLPGKDGRTICREVRESYPGPIVMLTALDEEVDQVVGLELGADDYITKPVRPRLLLSRIQALLRFAERSGQEGAGAASIASGQRIVLGGLEIHRPSRTVLLEGQPVELTTAQFDLLAFLASHAGETISRDRLYRHLHGVDYDGFNRSMDLTIGRLREKIGDNGKNPHLIKSIWGEGYMMVKPE